jgi:hypothetical protein
MRCPTPTASIHGLPVKVVFSATQIPGDVKKDRGFRSPVLAYNLRSLSALIVPLSTRLATSPTKGYSTSDAIPTN